MKTKLLPTAITCFLLATMLCLPVLSNRMLAQVPESYAVLNEDTGTLTFRHDAKKPAGAYKLNEGEEIPGWFVRESPTTNKNNIKKVVFDASFTEARPTSCYRWFSGCNELTTIEGIENLKTENVTNMGRMFDNCWNLTTLNLSTFDTKNVIDMNGMFFRCNNLITLNLSNFDTKNVIKMNAMFNVCKSLTELNISNFNTRNVTNMSGMFALCESLTKLDLSNFDTNKVTNMRTMFNACKSLTELNISNFDTGNVTDMSLMFSYCSNLATLNLSNFDTRNVTNMESMFHECDNLATIYVSNKFVTTACQSSENMFKGCKKLVGAVSYDDSKTNMEMANYITGYFTDITKTGVDAAPVSDNAVAKYYDALGCRLDTLQKGINIVKRGNKTTKVLVK